MFPHLNLGMAYAELGRLQEAIASLTQAARLDPNFAAAYHNLGYVLAKAGKYEDAVRAYKQAIQLKPDFVEAYHNLAVVYLDLGNRNLALAQYGKLKAFDKEGAEKLLDVIYQDRVVMVRKQ
jgi:tetratricopeptide (TPR) repeat protein